MTVETIPIPHERVQREENFTVRVRDLYAWPEQALLAHFEYNDLRDRWVWELEHERRGRLIPKSTVTIGYRYRGDMQYYMTARFIDETGDNEAATSENLGDTVQLAVYPGPLGGTVHPDSDLTERELDRLLDRRLWRPVR